MNPSAAVAELRTLFVGDRVKNGDKKRIEPLRMAFGFQPNVINIAEESSLQEALSLLRRCPFSQVVIELVADSWHPQNSANWILRVRELFPEVVFALYGDDAELDASIDSLSSMQRTHIRRFMRVSRSYGDQDVKKLAKDLMDCSAEKKATTRATSRYEYDAAISYASEDQEYASAIYHALSQQGVEVFYDDAVRFRTWGKRLPSHLKEIYGSQSRFCIVLASEAYKLKPYTRLELEEALASASCRAKEEYILPVRIDCDNLPGMPAETTYISRNAGIDKIVEEFRRRMGEFLSDAQFDA